MFALCREKWHYTLVNAFTDLKDKDTIRVMLRDPVQFRSPQTTNFGKESYDPMVQQTDYGVSKFFSILKYLVSLTLFSELHKFVIYMFKFMEQTDLDVSLTLCIVCQDIIIL